MLIRCRHRQQWRAAVRGNDRLAAVHHGHRKPEARPFVLRGQGDSGDPATAGMPEQFSAAMGQQMYTVRLNTMDEVQEFINYVHAKI